MKYFIAIIIILLIILYCVSCVNVNVTKNIEIYVSDTNVTIEAEVK